MHAKTNTTGRIRGHPLRIAAVLGVLALTATACGSSSNSGSHGSSTGSSATGSPGAAAGSSTAAAAGGSTGGPAIHFTVLGSDTGTYAQIGEAMYQGAVDGANAVNAAGGILGRKLVLDKVDTHGDPADAVSSLQQELAKNHPAAIIGPTTLEIFGIKPVIDQNKITDMFNGGSTAFDKNTDPQIWRINPSDSQEAVAIAMYAIQKGYKTAAVLFTTEASQQELEPFVLKDYKALGGQVVSVTNVTPGQSGYNSEITKILKSHPQAIIGQLDPPTAATFFSELTGLNGTKTPFVGTDITAGGDWISAVKPSVAKAMVVSVQGGTPTNQAGNTFNNLNQQAWHQAAQAGANYAYDGVLDVALAIDATGGTTNADIQKGLPLVSNPPGTTVYTYADGLKALQAHQKINYEGASGPMDFDKYHNVSGPWVVVASTGSGANLNTVETIDATQVAATESKIG